jgi:hypothetical protein
LKFLKLGEQLQEYFKQAFSFSYCFSFSSFSFFMCQFGFNYYFNHLSRLHQITSKAVFKPDFVFLFLEDLAFISMTATSVNNNYFIISEYNK